MFKKILCCISILLPFSMGGMRVGPVYPIFDGAKGTVTVPPGKYWDNYQAIGIVIEGSYYADEDHNIYFCFEDCDGNIVGLDISDEFSPYDDSDDFEDDYCQIYTDEAKFILIYPEDKFADLCFKKPTVLSPVDEEVFIEDNK